jgi:hypothetical protein
MSKRTKRTSFSYVGIHNSGHYSKNCPERRYNDMACQSGLFVGHVGEDSVYMIEEI